MSTQVVRHSSRHITQEFIFSENGETLWAFTAEGDGEIYSVESSNVASFRINGTTVSLPFSVVNGNDYSVDITKTNESLEAELKLNIRRAIDKTNLKIVPDYGQNDGRYIYCLSESRTTVYVIDTDLIYGSNYTGNGNFTISPIIQQITLPTLPNSASWSRIEFVIVNSNPKIIVCSDGDQVGSAQCKFYFSYINSDYSITNLDGTVVNGFTTFEKDNVPSARNLFQPQYDYVNNEIYFTEYYLTKLNLNTNSFTQITASSIKRYFFIEDRLNFNPLREEFVRGHDFNVNDYGFYNYRNIYQTTDRVVYSRVNNSYYRNGNNTPGAVYKESRTGELEGQTQMFTGAPTTYKTVICDGLGTAIRANINLVFIYDLVDLSKAGDINIRSTFTVNANFSDWKALEASDYAGLYLLLEKTSTNTDNRLFTCNHIGQVSYLDMPEAIRSIVANKLIN